MSFFKNIFKPKTAADTYGKQLTEANSYREEVAALSDEAIRAEVQALKTEVSALETDELIKKLRAVAPRVYALVREATGRTLKKPHFDVQLLGGFALANGKLAEMKTGEGKTQTAALALSLYALAGRGAHLVTVNDYLARWHASQMGPIYKFLGLSVGSIQHERSFIYDTSYEPEAEEVERLEAEVQGFVLDVKHMRPVTRKEAYAADITYGTNNEFGFDYLRDNMAPHATRMSQRELFFAIVDEVDSILIDEARTPLIISTPDMEPTQKYYEYASLVEKVTNHEHYTIDEKKKATSLTDAGISRIEELLKVPNIYDTSKGVTTIHHIEQALKAKTLFHKDRDYVVQGDEIIIVDEFTGRLMYGRRYSDGLHQAIEAKEGVKIQQESKTLATITFQNLFRLYRVLAGMTGTAKTEEEEFFKIYQLTVEQIPTHRPMVRKDAADVVYKSEEAKFKAIAKEVKARTDKGQPVLIGTVSIAKNELLAGYLKSEGVHFEALNAKNHEKEASIVAQAGAYKAVTLATNIAGRGVDILLGGNPVDEADAEKVRAAGGLHVIGTERHESRRIDNQLRGRSGRQGDPGSSQFFVSMEDDLMRLFGGERMKGIMDRLGLRDDEPIEAGMVSKSIEQAQKKIEGLNFDTRKHVLEFDDVLNHQRIIIYRIRRRYLPGYEPKPGEWTEEMNRPLKDIFLDEVKKEFGDIIMLAANQESITLSEGGEVRPELELIFEAASSIMPISEALKKQITEARESAADKDFATVDALSAEAKRLLDEKEAQMGPEIFDGAMRYVALQSLDVLWMEHLETMDHLRDSVRLRGWGQRDPLVEYKREGFELFERLVKEINKQIVYTVFKVGVVTEQAIEAPKPVVLQSAEGTVSSDSAPVDPKFEGVGRNDTCPCGSGKKFKKCHGQNA